MTMKPITIRIPEDMNDRLGYAAIDRKTTKQAIVIEALEAWFEKKEGEEKMEKLITAEERTRLQSSVIPVYHHYPRQHRPQPAYIVIDPEKDEGQVYADYSGEIGNAVTAYYWHNREHHIPLQAGAYGPDILEFIDSHAAEFLAIIEDYECQWDGSNYHGVWGETAQELLEKLERAAEDEIRIVPVVNDIDDLNLDIDADTNSQEYAQEVWDNMVDPYAGESSSWGESDWYPAFDLDDLVEYIERRVAELKEDEEDEDPA
jgi:predicted DNA-binding protein